MRQSILDSLGAVDLVGFQTYDDALNFLRSCESYLPGAHINFRRNSIWYRNHVTHVRDFPISIDVAALRQLAESPAVADCRAELQHVDRQAYLIWRVPLAARPTLPGSLPRRRAQRPRD
jgi:trehalose 6-phosphate synthase